jgi:transcriptional regulator with XRE-family HTH domain
MTFGQNMKFYREEKKISLDKLFRLTDIPVFRLKTYESDAKIPIERVKRRIANALKVSVYGLDKIPTDTYEELFPYLYTMLREKKVLLKRSDTGEILLAFQYPRLNMFLKKWNLKQKTEEDLTQFFRKETCTISTMRCVSQKYNFSSKKEILVFYRTASDMSEKQLAQKADVTVGWIQNFEDGQKLPSERVWEKLAEALCIFPELPLVASEADMVQILIAVSQKAKIQFIEENETISINFDAPILKQLLEDIYYFKIAIMHLESELKKSITKENQQLLNERLNAVEYEMQTICYKYMVKQESGSEKWRNILLSE